MQKNRAMCFDWWVVMCTCFLLPPETQKHIFGTTNRRRQDGCRQTSTSTPQKLSTASRTNREERLRAERHGNRKNNK